MPSGVAVLVSIALLFCAAALLLTGYEGHEHAHVASLACVAAVRAATTSSQGMFVSLDDCIVEQHWDTTELMLAAVALAGSLGLTLFAMARRGADA